MTNQKTERVLELIGSEVLDGLEPRQMLPSERKLATRFGVSRETVRRALEHLEEDGFVSRVHGSGTYKTDPLFVGKVVRPVSFADAMQERGHQASYKVLSRATTKAGPEVAAELQVEEGDQIFALERLLLADGEPIAIERSYIPTQRFSHIDSKEFDQSVYSVLLESYETPVGLIRQRIGATVLDSSMAATLGTRTGVAGLLLRATTMDPRGMAIVYSQATLRADRFNFDYTIRSHWS